MGRVRLFAATCAVLWACVGGATAEAAERTVREAMASWRQGDYASAVRDFKRLAKAGDGKAQQALARALVEGKGVKKDPLAASIWWRRAARAKSKFGMPGNYDAYVGLAELYETGVGVAKDLTAAARWRGRAAQGDGWRGRSFLQRLADQGVAEAQYQLFELADMSQNRDEHVAQTARYLEAAAKQGHTGAQRRLADYLTEGADPSEADRRASRGWMIKAAETGDTEALRLLAYGYGRTGRKLEGDKTWQAWVNRALAEGDISVAEMFDRRYDLSSLSPEMQARVLELTASSDGLPGFLAFYRYRDHLNGAPFDEAEAYPEYVAKAASGDAEAQLTLGLMTALGQGTERDAAKGQAWVEKAAASGLATAAYVMYEITKLDSKVANEWRRRAAELGHADSLWFAAKQAELYADDGKKIEAAAPFLLAAALAGHNEALFYLEIHAQDDAAAAQLAFSRYLTARKPARAAEARRWLRNAAEAGLPEAMVELKGK